MSSKSDMINIWNIKDNQDKASVRPWLAGQHWPNHGTYEYHFLITRRVCIAKLSNFSPERKNFSRHLIERSLKMYQNPGEDGEGGLNGA